MHSDHLQAFVRETEENITDLNNALLTLEADPADGGAVDEVFRTAHTLKGNFAAMGFDGPSRLAHALEDLLDAVREGRIEVSGDLMDLAFESVDRIEGVLGAIEAGNEVELGSDADGTIEAIRAALEAPPAGTGQPVMGGSKAAFEEFLAGLDRETLELGNGDDLYHARVAVRAGDMPSVDAMLALDALEDVLDPVATHPPRSAVEAGEVDDGLDLVVAGEDPEAIDASIAALDAADSVTIEPISLEAVSGPAGNGADVSPPAEETTDAGTGADVTRTDEAVKSVRVDVEQLDDLYGMVEGLVTGRITLRRAIEGGDLDRASRSLDELEKITAGLQDTVMDMRMVPVRRVVDRLPRLVRDLAREEDKQVDFEMTGTDIELDRTILSAIGDPLLHLVRNAIDHGIEPPDEREAADKDPTGSLCLAVRRQRDHVVIEIADDGRGLDRDQIAEKARQQGIVDEAELETMAADAIHELIFRPGFSTSEEVTDVSGRGVGMDVVHETVTGLDGSVAVDSTLGEGTTVTLRLPLTVAIVKVLFVIVGDREFGIPLKQVDEVTGDANCETIQGAEVIEHGEEIYPVIDLGETLAIGEADGAGSGAGKLIRIRPDDRPVALRCGAVTGQEEVVVKPLEGLLAGTDGLSGTAVLGAGNIVPILDVTTL